jgi:periplasmic copper chaperone A
MLRPISIALVVAALAMTCHPATAEEAAKPKAPAPVAKAPAKVAPIQIRDAYAFLQPPSSRATGAFMVVENKGTTPDALIGGSCDCAQAVELHVMENVAGRMSMRKTERFDLAPGAPLTLAPGKPHIMLIGLTKPLKADQPLKLRLRFEKAGEIEVSVPLRDPRAGR